MTASPETLGRPANGLKALWLLAGVTIAILTSVWLRTDWLHRVTFEVPLRQIEVPVVWWLVWGAYIWLAQRLSWRSA